jgi:LEA14-like dessication related protein
MDRVVFQAATIARGIIMLRIIRTLSINLVLLLLVSACVSMPGDFKEPAVSVISVKPVVTNSISPRFDILLRVTNPNRTELSIVGLTYTIHLSGNKVIEGVANQLPEIAPYGEADVTLEATADLFGGLSLLGDLLNNPTAPVDYEFNAQIDVGTFYPMVKVNKVGVLSFN